MDEKTDREFESLLSEIDRLGSGLRPKTGRPSEAERMRVPLAQLKLIKDRLENLRRALRQSSKGSERAATEKMTRRLGEMRDVLSSELAELKDSMTRIGGREEGGDAGRLERVEQMLKVIGKFLQQREREEQQQLQTSIDALRLVTTDIGSFASEDRRRYENVESMATNLVTIAKLVQDIGGGVDELKTGMDELRSHEQLARELSDAAAAAEEELMLPGETVEDRTAELVRGAIQELAEGPLRRLEESLGRNDTDAPFTRIQESLERIESGQAGAALEERFTKLEARVGNLGKKLDGVTALLERLTARREPRPEGAPERPPTGRMARPATGRPAPSTGRMPRPGPRPTGRPGAPPPSERVAKRPPPSPRSTGQLRRPPPAPPGGGGS